MENNENEKAVAEVQGADPAPAVKTSLGMEEKLEGLFCYLFGPITGLIFLLAEKNSSFVKFHAIQSLALGILFAVVWFVLDNLLFAAFWYLWSFISMLVMLFSIGYMVLTIFLMVKAFKMERFKLPLLGEFSEKRTAK